MGNIFVRRPIFAMVIAIMIVVLGIIAIRSMPIEQYPNITPPMVEVSAEYLGADALTVEQSVATPLEEGINGVSDMLYMESTNSSNGSMSLQITFNVGSNPDMNTIFTQNRVSSSTPLLPQSVITQGVTTQKTMTSFIMVMSLYSDGRYDETFLSNYAVINLKDRISRINGVGNVEVLGGGQYAMRIWIKPERVNYYGIAVNDIIGAVKSQSELVPGGILGAEPTVTPTQYTYTTRIKSGYNTAEEFGQIIIRANSDGSLLRLKDVAEVQLGAQTYNIKASYQGQPCAMLLINQAPGSNAVEVGGKVDELMAEFASEMPEGMHYSTMVDSTATIISGIKDIVITLLIALVLVVLVIYIFLQDIRTMIIPLVAIPVSLVGAFMVFPLFGFSINVFSLLGMVLAIGLVVDDAIVVVEAVRLNIEKGMPPKKATIEAMKVVTSPIIATTSVLMAVFLPVGLMPGAAGLLYKQFAITIAITVFISGINALSLSPALCSIVLKPRGDAQHKGLLGRFFNWFNLKFNKNVDGYLKKSAVLARHGGRTLIFIGITVIVIFVFMKKLPSGFLPDEDQGYIIANIQLPNAASLNRTEDVVAQMEKIIGANPNVNAIAAASGFSILGNTDAPNTGVMFIRLKDFSQRKMTAMEISNELNGILYEEIDAAEVFTFGPPSIPGLGPSSGFTIMIQDKGGNTPQYLAKYTNMFIEEARKHPEIASISTMYQADIPQKMVTVNNEKAMTAGIPLDEIHALVATYLGGAYINNFNRFGRMYQTYIQADSKYRMTEQDLDMFYITNERGESFPLASFINVSDTTGPSFTNRFNLYRSASVSGLPSLKYSTAQTMQVLSEVADEVLPQDMGYAWSNMSYQIAQKSGAGVVFLYAVVFIFLILAALYESWSLPLSIILGIPFAVFGAMTFMFLAHLMEAKFINNIFLQISLIMLIGLAAKNAILIVEYAKNKFDEGMSLKDAAMEGARLRIRPVVMTAVAFLMGVIPLIIASGSNAVARNVMGVALFGGMLIATIIGVFAYPALFVWIGKLAGYEVKRDKKRNSDEQ